MLKGLMFENQKRQHVAKCPTCGEPHHYTEVKFPMINDRGSWVIQCGKCPQRFVVHLRNPAESDAGRCNVVERFDDDVDPYDGNDPPAGGSAVHNLQMNRDELRFSYDSDPIYRCAVTDDDLEAAALAAMTAHHGEISSQIAQAMNLYLAQRAPNVDHAVISVQVTCSCGAKARARKWICSTRT